MLLMFSLSITPKLFLHDLVVRHRDSSISSGKYVQVGKTGFRCDCENQVVELPFLTQVGYFSLTAPVYFPVYALGTDYRFYSFPHFIFGLRGPPVTG